jgi:hypothetical protein
MRLLPFLEICIGDMDLWPAYVLRLLFFENPTCPLGVFTVAAFLYRHGVPLKVAPRVYTLCNTHAAVSRALPYVLGGYYAAFYYSSDTPHMAKYYDVRQSRILWVNGCNLSQVEPVLPYEYPAFSPLDCRTLRDGRVAAGTVLRIRTSMRTLCDEPAFHMMDL